MQAEMVGQLVGTVVGSGWRIEEVVGEGGMGLVYRATNTTTGQPAAVKFLKPEWSDDDSVVRFNREAAAGSEIRSNDLVAVLTNGVTASGLRFIVMEWVEGGSLQNLLDDEGARSPRNAVDIALKVARALARLHLAKIVHRDLKPDNVFITKSGTIKLGDLGIAKLQEAVSLTQTGTVLGTPGYMSPEQADGNRDVDVRTDVYALGVLICHLLLGRLPFSGEGLGEIMAAQRTELPIRLLESCPGVPETLETLANQMLEPDPNQRRPVRMAQVVNRLEAIRNAGLSDVVRHAVGPGTSRNAADATGVAPAEPPVLLDTPRRAAPASLPLTPARAAAAEPPPPATPRSALCRRSRRRAPLMVALVAALLLGLGALAAVLFRGGQSQPALEPATPTVAPAPPAQPTKVEVKPTVKVKKRRAK